MEKPTIFEQATDLPLLDWEKANEQVVTLTQRISSLELAIGTATKLCHLKKSGFCYINCRALPYCTSEGLTWLSYADLPDSFVEALCGS
jgi:hypothetical protein